MCFWSILGYLGVYFALTPRFVYFSIMKRLYTTILPIALLAFSLFFASCSDDSNAPEARLNETDLKIHYDDTFRFFVEGYNVDEWELSTDSIGSIDEDGIFKASRIGEAELSALIKGVAGFLTAKITVEPYVTDFKMPLLKIVDKETVMEFEGKDVELERDHLLLYLSDNPNINEYSYVFTAGELSLVTYQLADYDEALFYAETFLRERFPETEISREDKLEFYDKYSDTVIAISKDGRYPEIRFRIGGGGV